MVSTPSCARDGPDPADQIRPDWEHKLNAVKAAAARRASRRIVMRQVGDRLIPVGYTSSRATGQADFSASIAAQTESGGTTPSRRNRRRESDRSRDLEELMIMEAMRLSLVDHEDHQRKIADDTRGKQPRRDSDARSTASKASKLFSKFGNRSRSGSTASATKLGMSMPSSRASISSATGSQIALVTPTSPQQALGSPPPPRPISAPSPVPAVNPQSYSLADVAEGQPTVPLLIDTEDGARASSSRAIPYLHPRQATTVAPITTLDSVSAPLASSPRGSAADGLPRLSLDMPTLTPDATRKVATLQQNSTLPHMARMPLDRSDSEISEAASEATARPYAALDSPTEV